MPITCARDVAWQALLPPTDFSLTRLALWQRRFEPWTLVQRRLYKHTTTCFFRYKFLRGFSREGLLALDPRLLTSSGICLVCVVVKSRLREEMDVATSFDSRFWEIPSPSMPDAPPSLSWSSSSLSSNTSPSTSKNPSPLAKWSTAQGSNNLPDLNLSSAAMDFSCRPATSSTTYSSSHTREVTSSEASSATASDYEDDEVVQPVNFAYVNPGLYRSSFPRPHHYTFLRSLGLKTVVCVLS